MPGAGRLGDRAQVDACAHGCPGCPHPCLGPAITGSPTVLIDGRPALRVDDAGVHTACCAANLWSAMKGAPTVFINNKAAFRMNDPARHCGGLGRLIEGSDKVIIGDGASAGGGAGSTGSAAEGAAAAGAAGGAAGAASSATSAASPASNAGGDGGGAGSEAASSAPAAPESAAPAESDPAESDPAAVAEDGIEIQLVNSAGEPRGGVVYELTLPDGSTRTGRSDAQGRIAFSHLTQTGDCELRLPELDERS